MASAANPSELIKHLSQFSGDGILQAIQLVFPDDNESTHFLQSLEKLSSVLIKPIKTTTISKRKKLPTSIEVFNSRILPTIRQSLADYEHAESVGQECALSSWTLSKWNFDTDYSSMTLDSMKDAHAKILRAEKELDNLQLFVRFHRGLLYVKAYEAAGDQKDFNAWFLDKFSVTYSSARRYITVALLLLRYPRLLISGLSFDQIYKHNTNIIKHFTLESEGLGDWLAISLEVAALGTKIEVNPHDIDIPELPYKVTDPGSSYYEMLEEDEFEPTDKSNQTFNQSMIESKQSGDLALALRPMAVTSRRSHDAGLAAVASGVR